MTRLRELARLYAAGELDKEGYRSARVAFIEQVVKGMQFLEVNEYRGLVDPNDDTGVPAVCPAIFVLDEDLDMGEDMYEDEEGFESPRTKVGWVVGLVVVAAGVVVYLIS